MQDEDAVVDAEVGIAAPEVEYPTPPVGSAEEPVETIHPAVADAVEAVLTDDEDDAWETPERSADATTPDASAETPAPPAEEVPDDEPRRPRGWLETDVERLLQGINTLTVTIPEGQKLTPHFVAKKLAEVEGLTKEPSTGAVAAVFDRWVKCGAAEMAEKPYAFIDFTTAAKERGIATLKAEVREAKKAGAAPAPEAAAPEPEAPAAE